MALKDRLEALAQAVASDVKNIRTVIGALNALETLDKTSLVAAINEALSSGGGAGGAAIDDAAGAGVVNKTWSADKILAELEALRVSIVDGAPEALDTLKEIADLLNDNESAVSGLINAVANRVSYADTQALTEAQKLTACQNIGVGDPEVDLLAIYEAAKA